MQLGYLLPAWLNNTEQSLVKKQFGIKLDTPLPQILVLMKRAIAPIQSSCTAFFKIVPQLEGNSCQA
jgi:hypothetical protein